MSARRQNSKPKPIWRRRGRTLVPANEVAEALLASLKDNIDYLGDVHGARSVRQLRLWWGLCGILVDHDIFPSKEAASDIIKIGCGHVEMRIDPASGDVSYVPKSIAFESLAQHEFNVLFEAALLKIIERWCVGWNCEQLREQVFEAIDPPEMQALGRRAA